MKAQGSLSCFSPVATEPATTRRKACVKEHTVFLSSSQMWVFLTLQGLRKAVMIGGASTEQTNDFWVDRSPLHGPFTLRKDSHTQTSHKVGSERLVKKMIWILKWWLKWRNEEIWPRVWKLQETVDNTSQTTKEGQERIRMIDYD